MKYLYHRKPPTMIGQTLYPLNRLQDVHPDLFDDYIKKYANRRWVTEQTIPILDDCLWNDVVFTSAVHPQELLDARRDVGFPDMLPHEYYEIDPRDLNPINLAVFLFKPGIKHGQSLKLSDFAPYKYEDLTGYGKISQETIDYFNDIYSSGGLRIPLFWKYVPHVIYRGSIDVTKANIIVCS